MTSPEDVGLGIQTMVETFQRLGLMWRLVKGTVFNSATNTPTLTRVTLDTDTDPSNCISMIGSVPVDARVYVLVVPPQGNYIVGLGTHGSIINETGIANAAPSDSTTSATFVNLAGTSSFSFTKGSSGSRLKVTINASAYVNSVANTRIALGVQINGTDYEVFNMLINPTTQHTPMAGFIYIPASAIPADTYTIQGRWRRAGGTGTLTRDNGDWFAMSVKELP